MKNKFIVLHKEKPHKVYKINVKHKQQVSALCKFLREDTNKKIEIILNGKSIVFASLADKKRFVVGFEQANRILSEVDKHVEVVQPVLPQNTNTATEEINKYAACCALANIRVETLQDKIAEIEQDKQILLETIATLKKGIQNVG